LSIKYDPASMLKKLAPKRKIERLLSGRVTLKKTALSFLDDADFIDKNRVMDVALKTVNGYQERIAKAQADAGLDKSAGKAVKDEITDSPKQLIQRVQNEIVYQVAQGIQEKYEGEIGIWMPSSADEPDPEHALNYGKEYVIGVGINGEEPGDRYGCQCGVEIKTRETKLNL
jgi:hypothetical protein